MAFIGARTVMEQMAVRCGLLFAFAVASCNDATNASSTSLVSPAGDAAKDNRSPPLEARGGKVRRPAAQVYVLDTSTSTKNHLARCRQAAVRLTRERSRLRPKEDLWVYLLALGDRQGALHQEVVGWHLVAGEKWSGDLLEDPKAAEGRTQAEQRRVVGAITEECAAKIKPSKGSPLLASVQRALELLNHQCGTERREGCSQQKIFVFSDLQDRAVFARSKRSVLMLGAVTIEMCGYAESVDEQGTDAQELLLARWRDLLGPALLPLAPTCPTEDGAPSGGPHD